MAPITCNILINHAIDQDQIARLDSERSEQIEQLKSEHVQHLEEVKDTAMKAAFEDLEDDLFDGLSDITMLATFSAMQEVWPKEETRL